ncbi:hsp90-like protein [Saccharata proteae CBS 121410]|uniref:Hsp90 chaperone protein kinase-targeting subunit n=1 Tax=Saccharata proteae CBS 121410 TaxID=1314787 RepID=A0A9P4HRW1_9PEZI|nr:hsp90-like protein [Saccharata proteae CBS 121410]
MPVDYSKWDALELSDDSDIEVHPNVDKRSFIRAKQTQIHAERQQRKHQIATLKYERIINDGLLKRIDNLLTALKSHKDAPNNPEQLVMVSLMESAGDPAEDQPPEPPAGVHENVKDKPSFSRMMAALVDQVKKEVDEKKPEDRYQGFIDEVTGHREHVDDLQKQLLQKLAELEKEESRHITSDNIHTGFDYSSVKKDSSSSATQAPKPAETVELLNPGGSKRPDLQSRTDTGQSSGADADIEEGLNADDEEDIQASATAKQFAKIEMGDYRTMLQFISAHPELLVEKETDGLLVEAFSAETDGKHKYARQCVHHALLLQYCRQLGRDGVGLFFKRITTKDHQAQKLFNDDVNNTYARIHTRVAELAAENKNPSSEGVEQIQLHAVDPNTTINITVPPPDAATEEDKARRQIFEAFPPGLQRALESKKLDEVNKVLAKMSVEEAEEVVEKLGDGGMLSVEEGVIDATTEEGRRQMEEIEKTGHMPGIQSYQAGFMVWE